MKKYILEGLDCADCALKIEKNLKDKEYVKDISVSYATKTMLIDTENIEKVKEDINVIEKDVKF